MRGDRSAIGWAAPHGRRLPYDSPFPFVSRTNRRSIGALFFLCLGMLGGSAVVSQENRQIPEQERELVKAVHQARDSYQASLEKLRTYYALQSNEEGRGWVEREMTDFHLLVKNPYILDMDLPNADLKADTSLPKANRLFAEALNWLNKYTLTEKEQNTKRAELLFRKLLREYPRSDKLDETCYYLGDIYTTKYFQQYRRSVAFYERVLIYDPNTNLDARIKAARLYERYISDRRRAIELYQDVLRREVDPDQTREARRRLDDLLGTRSAERQ